MADDNHMAFLSNRIQREELLPGHHIYAWRRLSTYAHHGIFVENNMVIHFGNPGSGVSSFRPSSSSSSSVPCLTCSEQPYYFNGVKRSCLDCFLQKDSLHLYRYGVINWYYNGARGGTCTTAKSSNPDVVVHRAQYLLRNGFGGYNLIHNNCEDFALYCKTGRLVSGGIGVSGQIGTVHLFSGTIKRHRHDIGCRPDAEEVEVEKVGAWHLRNANLHP